MKAVSFILLFCLAQAVWGSYFDRRSAEPSDLEESALSDEEQRRSPDPKRPAICRTKPRLCEKIRFKVCSKACITPKKPSCCAYRVKTVGEQISLGGAGLCFTQGYIKRNFKLTLAKPTASGKEQAQGKDYLFMCPKGTDLLGAASRRAAPTIEKNWPKMVAKMGAGEVGYFGVRSSSWVKSSTRRSPSVQQLVSYTQALLAARSEQEMNADQEEADQSDDKFVDYMLTL